MTSIINKQCFITFISKALVAFSTATYCYSLPTNVEIKSEADVRKYAIRFSFATHVANRVYNPKLKEEYKWIQHPKYLDSIFKVMDDAIDVALNKGEGNDKVEFQNGVAIFKNTDPKTYTNANKNAVLLYSWIYMNLNNGNTSIDSVANKLKDKYKGVDFKKAVSDVKGYRKALHLRKWISGITNNLLTNETSRKIFSEKTKIRIAGGNDSESGYQITTDNIKRYKDTYLMVQLQKNKNIPDIKVHRLSYIKTDKKNCKDGCSVYSGQLDEYMNLTIGSKKETQIYNLKSLEQHPYITPRYSYSKIKDKNVAILESIVLNKGIEHKNITIMLYTYNKLQSSSDKTEYKVVIGDGFFIQNDSGSSMDLDLQIIDSYGTLISAIPNSEGNFSLGTGTIDESDTQNKNNILRKIDFYGLDTSCVNSLEGLLKNNTKLTTVKNIKKVTKNIYNFSKMYYGCTILQDYTPLPELLGIGHKKKNIELDISEMFAGCKEITMADLKGIDFARYNSVNMERLYAGCSAINTINMGYTSIKDDTQLEKAFEDIDNLMEINVEDATIGKKKESSNSDAWKILKQWANAHKVKLTT